MRGRQVIFSWILTIFTLNPALATTYVVNPDGTGDFPTIQEAIDSATDGDTIELTDGTFTGEGNRNIDFLGKAITVRSQSGDRDACVIDCQGSATEPLRRGFSFQTNEGRSSVLQGVTVQNGWVDVDGGDNDGGAITIAEDCSPTVTNCLIWNNYAGAYGGGIYCSGAALIVGCEVRENTCGNRGGGIMTRVSEGAEITDCEIIGNAGGDGGGIHCRVGTTITGCLIRENSAISGYGYGGGISCRNHHGTISNCTLYENSALQAGGIAFYGEGPLVQNCVIAGTTDGGALGWGYSGPNSTPTIRCCDLWDNQGGFGNDIPSGMIDGGGNISLDPLFCGDDSPDMRFGLHADSPCAPFSEPNEECDLIGAFGISCDPTAIQLTRWGSIKLSYR